ncbi:MAG: rod shape-determining protein MreD [Bacteroides sp.]|nr:rod shape-determining protein MreD [Bacteroides sp.]MBD5277460.1 rod shape-determining protein MreD [Bacteroides sp.]MDE6043772.1 rod shape-determining protein MreD [Muribaculaceae bacterium]
MTKTILNALLLLVLLVPAQAVIFNNLALFGVALPLVFIYVLISLPVTLATNWVLTIGFLSGLAVDVFSDTPGLNAFSCTVLAFVRRPVLRLYVPQDEELGAVSLGLQSLGQENYLKYMISMVVLYCTLVFTIEAFELFNLRLWALRIVCSSLYTFVFVYAFASLASRSSRREKRL